MTRYLRSTDQTIRLAPWAIAGIFTTVLLSRAVPWLWPLLVAETVAALGAAIFLLGRWRLLTAWDALGFTSYRKFMLYDCGLRGRPWGLLLATMLGVIVLFSAMDPGPSASAALIGAIVFCLSVGRASQRWPVDALEKADDR